MANAIMIALGKPKKHMGMGGEEPERSGADALDVGRGEGGRPADAE